MSRLLDIFYLSVYFFKKSFGDFAATREIQKPMKKIISYRMLNPLQAEVRDSDSQFLALYCGGSIVEAEMKDLELDQAFLESCLVSLWLAQGSDAPDFEPTHFVSHVHNGKTFIRFFCATNCSLS